MAQAVAAQAFARAALMIPEQSNAYLRAARGAFDVIPRHLLTSVAAGPWIRLYAFQPLAVLNAQLQAVVSLTDYAQASEDSSATALAARMKAAAAATLPKFDTGYWTYYSLPHEPSPLDYQQYVVQLLAKLAPTDPRFAAARDADRRVREAAARVHGRERRARDAAPLALEAGDRSGRVGRGPDTPAVALGRLGHRRCEGADARRRLSGSGDSHRLGGNRSSFDALPIVRVATTASQAKTARKGSDAETAPTPSLAVGAALDDPSQAALAQKLGLRVVRMGVAWPAGLPRPRPEPRGGAAAGPGRSRAGGRAVRIAAAGRRRRAEKRSPSTRPHSPSRCPACATCC